jgi:serine/threonine protein kinase HipA of HipAB toxin-antitoxin module
VRLTLASLTVIAAVFTVTADADVRATKRDAELLRQKVAGINAEAEKPSKQGRRTTVTESEVNAYLAYDAGSQIPVGVVEPYVSILGTGRSSGRASTRSASSTTRRACSIR